VWRSGGSARGLGGDVGCSVYVCLLLFFFVWGFGLTTFLKIVIDTLGMEEATISRSGKRFLVIRQARCSIMELNPPVSSTASPIRFVLPNTRFGSRRVHASRGSPLCES